MLETKIATIRHASPEDDMGPGKVYSPQAPLSELGHQQADRLRGILQEEGIAFDEIYMSPLPRVCETAKPLPLTKDGHIHVVEGFAEPDLGGHIGRAFSDIPRSVDGTLLDFYTEDVGQTPFLQTAKQVKDALDEVISRIKPGQNIGIVTHGIIGKFIMHFLRNPHAELPLCESDLRTRDQLGNAEANLITLSIDKPTNERRLNAKHMDVIKVKEYLHMSYPQANIIETTQIDGVATEAVAELGESDDGQESRAIAVIRRSLPHHHDKTTEIYTILDGTLHVVLDGKEIILHKGDKPLKIEPRQVHFAYGEDVWVDVVSQPPYSPDDVFED